MRLILLLSLLLLTSCESKITLQVVNHLDRPIRVIGMWEDNLLFKTTQIEKKDEFEIKVKDIESDEEIKLIVLDRNLKIPLSCDYERSEKTLVMNIKEIDNKFSIDCEEI